MCSPRTLFAVLDVDVDVDVDVDADVDVDMDVDVDVDVKDVDVKMLCVLPHIVFRFGVSPRRCGARLGGTDCNVFRVSSP